MERIRKYPRTPHLTGSKLQPGDEDLAAIPVADLLNEHVVVEEKIDGANSGLSFDADGQLWLQSRGHYLTGGPRERHFNLFKQWAHTHAHLFWEVLGDRYLVYGEWMYAKHTVFYDALPHYFLEFDVYDRQEGVFLSTERRRELLVSLPIVSVPVLWEGKVTRKVALESFMGPSLYKSVSWRASLESVCEGNNLDAALAAKQTDDSNQMEGLYLKVERDGQVVERFKYVRASFMQAIASSDGHWHDRPILPNQLAKGVDIFATS